MKEATNSVKLRNIIVTSYLTIILNLFCIVLGILYILNPTYSILWDIFGVILTITLFENLLYIYFNLHKRNILRVKTRGMSYVFLIVIIFAIPCMMLGNLLLSVIYSNNLIDTLGAYMLTYFGYFSILIYGFSFALFNIVKLSNIDLLLLNHSFNIPNTRKYLRTKRITRKILVIVSRITFILGILFAVVIIFGSFEVVTTFIAIISGQFGIFFSLIFLANTILLLKLKGRKRTTKKYYRTAILGFFVSGCLLMPVLMTNFTVINARKSFTSAFGNDWQDRIPSSASQYFLRTPFSLTGYFLGTQPKDCKIETNTLFYNDEGIRLYFDAYTPLSGREDLPGENSTIIRIHGGSWVSGDKGMMNMLQMNKYFAAQGYVVFDIQYGLDSNLLFEFDPLTPDYKKGNFDIDDMMRHIGEFTKYLTLHATEYGANLDSVFLSGGSAGGHLASAVALAIASNNYTEIFGANLTIKGLVPFYPANGQMVFFGISGSGEFKHPEKLINQTSPPCLIFQGTHDILNYFSISENIRDTYNSKGNDECAILWLPMAGHASDFYFSGYYNQIFLYFMERFMYLYH
ncbi:MAG: alpha/beta hydrolase fold domain-containing protein [Candidatus Lokiarchaeota archaeon]|nr:alpha/beta hydrolase fold domain-containing protein [Candidatus Lokiarchaeota archaeon]